MYTGLAKLKKLRRMSVRELRVRSRQELMKYGERVFNPPADGMSDAAFLREVAPEGRNCSAQGTAAAIVGSVRPDGANAAHPDGRLSLPILGRRDEVAAIMERRFPRQRRAIIEKAERAMRGQFDLLGLKGVHFGDPIDWHLEPLSGKRAPLDHWSKINYLDPGVAGDKKITWELNRHQHFVTFGQAYWMTGDERFAATFMAQAASWMDANPPKLGINWASSLEVAFRSIAWLWALRMLNGSRHLTPEFALRVLKCLLAHGRHIENYLSHYFSPNTHLTGEALGLFYLGVALPELRRAQTWRDLGLKILIEQLPQQVREDGVYFEQATYYHRYTADFYTHLVALADANGITLPDEIRPRLEQVMDHLMWITQPDGSSPLLGDDDGGRLIFLGERPLDDFRDTLATGAALFGRGDWKYVAGDAAVETLWLLGPDGLARYDELEGRAPDECSRAFDLSGYYVMRDGWAAGSSYVILDCGPHGADACGHAHADALALNFAAMGKAWLVDPGTFTYTADADARDEFRATRAHNTVTVDGQSQSIPAKPFAWHHVARASLRDFIAGDGVDYFEGEHDGYERLADPVIHRRAALFVKSPAGAAEFANQPSYLVIRDTFLTRGSHRYEIRFHLAAGCLAVAEENRVLATEPGGLTLSLAAFSEGELIARVEQGWVSRAYGQREAGLVAVFEVKGGGPQEVITFIAPSAGRPSICIEQQSAGGGSMGFCVKSGELLDVVLPGDGKGRSECGPLAACGLMAWGRFVGDRLVRACLIHGNALETGKGFALHSPSAIRYYAAQRDENAFKISINGANRFSVEFDEPAARVVVNGMSFSLNGNRRRAAFTDDGRGWELSDVG